MTRAEFAASIKGKYPQYKDVADDTLVDAMLSKYPQYKNVILKGEAEKPLKEPTTKVGGWFKSIKDTLNEAGPALFEAAAHPGLQQIGTSPDGRPIYNLKSRSDTVKDFMGLAAPADVGTGAAVNTAISKSPLLNKPIGRTLNVAGKGAEAVGTTLMPASIPAAVADAVSRGRVGEAAAVALAPGTLKLGGKGMQKAGSFIEHMADEPSAFEPAQKTGPVTAGTNIFDNPKVLPEHALFDPTMPNSSAYGGEPLADMLENTGMHGELRGVPIRGSESEAPGALLGADQYHSGPGAGVEVDRPGGGYGPAPEGERGYFDPQRPADSYIESLKSTERPEEWHSGETPGSPEAKAAQVLHRAEGELNARYRSHVPGLLDQLLADILAKGQQP